MPLIPGGYNRVDSENPSLVWTECSCGRYKTRKRQAGRRMPRMVIGQPFPCPKCGKELSSSTVLL